VLVVTKRSEVLLYYLTRAVDVGGSVAVVVVSLETPCLAVVISKELAVQVEG
jgi:hypothetical protein